MFRIWIGSMVALAAFAAQAQQMEAGEWEFTNTMSSPMLPQPQTMTMKRCLTSKEVSDPEGEMVANAESDGAGPLDALSRSSDAKALAECLGRLEGMQRQAIMLAFFEGLSHSELAAHLREPLGTVKTWVRRGLIRLKTCLEPAK